MKQFVSFTFCVLFFSSYAQQWLDKYNQSAEYYNNFQLDEARKSAEEALSLYSQEYSEPNKNRAAILRQLVLICSETGELTPAISYAREEIEVLQKLGLDNDMYYANALNNLGVLRSSRSEYEAAKVLFQEAVKLSLQYNTEESPEVAQFKGNYAVTLFHLGKDDEAEQLFTEAIAVLQQMDQPPYDFYTILYEFASLKAARADYATALNVYLILEDFYGYDAPNYQYGGILVKSGDALDNLGRYDEAVEKYRKAITTLESIGEEASVDYTIAQNNLSIDLQKTGEFKAAKDLIESLIATREANIEEEPGAYAITAINYGNLLMRNGEHQQASTYFQKVFDTYQDYELTQDLTYVNALESMSEIKTINDELDSAFLLIEEAVTIADEKKLLTKKYSLFNQKSKILLGQTKYEEAKQAGKNALTLAQQSFGTGSIQAAYVQNSLAGIYAELGNYEQADKLYASSLPIFENAFGSDHPEYATSAANYSSLLQQMGNYYRAEVYLLEAVDIKEKSLGTQNLDYLATYENLGLLYYNTARYTEALRTLESIRKKKEELLDGDDPMLAYTYANLANVKKQTADYPEAEKYFKKAEQILATSLGEEHIQYAGTINNMALLYQKMGNIETAKPLFNQALTIYENKLGKYSPDYATALENLATLYQMEENHEKARELLEEALRIDEQILGKNHPLYSKTLHNLASIYEEEENHEKARELYMQSLDIDRSIYGETHPSYASTLYNLAVLEQELENFEQAKEYYEQVVDIRREILGENHPDYAYSLYGLASINQRMDNLPEANKYYKTVIEKYLNNIREYFPALSETEKSAFYGKIRPVFEAYMDFAVDFVRRTEGTEEDRVAVLTQLYDLQLSTKALLLNASNKVRNRILTSGDEELISLFENWVALKENIVKSLALSKEEIEENNVDIAAMQDEANDIEKELSLRSNAFASEFDQKAISWTDVRDQLTEDEAAIEIIRIKKNLKNDSILYATLILQSTSEAGPQLTVIANGDELEEKAFKTYKNSIVYKVTDKNSYGLFWKKIDEELDKNISNIYMSADGVYNKVNIATLMDDKGKYIVDKYNIRLLSNTKELIPTGQDPQVPNAAEIFGYPSYNLDKKTSPSTAMVDQSGMRYSFGDEISELPGTLEEINNIAGLMEKNDWEKNIYTEQEASEENIKKLDNPKIFHVATHGFFLEDIQIDENSGESLASRNMKYNPLMRSGLLFAGAENTIREEDIPGSEDGILTAYEAMNLNLDNTELVVMSACETGLGEVKNGEGVYGLQRSFMVAGAENLIMSLWKVSDETTQLLMSTFYKEWFSGKTKIEAFNDAIKEVKKNFKEPYYWGAFVILGK